MRRRLILLVVATSSLIVVAFLVPLAILVRASAADRALSDAIVDIESLAPTVATAEEQGIAHAVQLATSSSARRITVFLPNGHVLGEPAPVTAAVRPATATAISRPSGTSVVRL